MIVRYSIVTNLSVPFNDVSNANSTGAAATCQLSTVARPGKTEDATISRFFHGMTPLERQTVQSWSSLPEWSKKRLVEQQTARSLDFDSLDKLARRHLLPRLSHIYGISTSKVEGNKGRNINLKSWTYTSTVAQSDRVVGAHGKIGTIGCPCQTGDWVFERLTSK